MHGRDAHCDMPAQSILHSVACHASERGTIRLTFDSKGRLLEAKGVTCAGPASKASSDRLMTCTEGFWKGLLAGANGTGSSSGASDACDRT